MNDAGETSGNAPDRPPEDRLAWRVHLLAANPARSVLVIALLAAFCGIILVSYEWVFLVVAVVVFLTSLGPFFFPTYYELTPEGPSRRILFVRTRRRWSEFRGYFWDQHGVRLSAFSFRSWLEPLRGLFLPFDGNREEVLAYLARHVRRPARQVSGEGERERGRP